MKRFGLGLVVLLIVALIVGYLVINGVPGKVTDLPGADYVQDAKDAAEQFRQAVEQRTNEYVDGDETP